MLLFEASSQSKVLFHKGRTEGTSVTIWPWRSLINYTILNSCSDCALVYSFLSKQGSVSWRENRGCEHHYLTLALANKLHNIILLFRLCPCLQLFVKIKVLFHEGRTEGMNVTIWPWRSLMNCTKQFFCSDCALIYNFISQQGPVAWRENQGYKRHNLSLALAEKLHNIEFLFRLCSYLKLHLKAMFSFMKGEPRVWASQFYPGARW